MENRNKQQGDPNIKGDLKISKASKFTAMGLAALIGLGLSPTAAKADVASSNHKAPTEASQQVSTGEEGVWAKDTLKGEGPHEGECVVSGCEINSNFEEAEKATKELKKEWNNNHGLFSGNIFEEGTGEINKITKEFENFGILIHNTVDERLVGGYMEKKLSTIEALVWDFQKNFVKELPKEKDEIRKKMEVLDNYLDKLRMNLTIMQQVQEIKVLKVKNKKLEAHARVLGGQEYQER